MCRALCSGGDTFTASDVAVLVGRMELGDRARVAASVPEDLGQQAWATIQQQLAAAVDRMKTKAGDAPVIVVGGGAPLLGDTLPGASVLVRPPHAEVANAVGAAIPQVSGTVDAVFRISGSREEVLQRAQ